MFGFGNFTMHFHPSIKGPGLYPTEAAPLDFILWFRQVSEDKAHFSNRLVNGYQNNIQHF